MNPYEKIPPAEIQFFKEKVQRWVKIDSQIMELESQLRELKKVRSKELEPQITAFMTQNNIADLNTENGKLRCKEKRTKQALNKNNIRLNLSKYLESEKIDLAIDDLWNNREEKVTYQIQKMKK
tara:strand:+ start:757 stop:1128 length:372 start_codon:yes stop_codon:yes gene_type:complete